MDTKTFSISLRDTLVLRFIQPDEAEILFAAVDKNRACLRKRLNWVDKQRSPVDSRTTIEKRLQAAIIGRTLELGIYRSGVLIGSMGFNEISQRNKFGEIGYWLSEEFQGQGIMIDSVRALITYGFRMLQLHRIEIRCSTVNPKSAAIAERLGFTFEGIARGRYFLYDHFEDDRVYSMLTQEWKN